MISATMIVTTVPVTDLERARKFYGATLGLELLWETPAALRYRCGAVSELSVFKRPPVGTEHTLAHFEVDDIEAAVRDLGRPAWSSSTTAKDR
jgi:catechol 2,3-dioxygenase-like lactoylglutathione lyase family enzyme